MPHMLQMGQIYMVTFCNWIANYLGWGIIFLLTKDEHCYITGVQKQKTGGDMTDKTIQNKKGNVGWILGSWDDKGTFYYQQVEVISCGKVRMALRDYQTGNTIGNHFHPDTPLYINGDIAKSEAIDAANQFIENRKKLIQKRLDDHQAKPYPCSYYTNNMETKMAFFEAMTGKGKAYERRELLQGLFIK